MALWAGRIESTSERGKLYSVVLQTRTAGTCSCMAYRMAVNRRVPEPWCKHLTAARRRQVTLPSAQQPDEVRARADELARKALAKAAEGLTPELPDCGDREPPAWSDF